MNKQLTSVALCTYNGEEYIIEQLNSIIEQTITTNEIIICDDCSTDNTVIIIQEFIERNKTQNIKFFINNQNLGFVKNFEKCISLSTHEYIFLSDQDDFWFPDKIERTLNFFKNHPNLDMVFTNALVVDEKLNSLGVSMSETLDFNKTERKSTSFDWLFRKLSYTSLVVGATVCIKNNQKQNILPFIKNEHYIHDAWLGLVLSYQNKLGYLDEYLIKYRQHSKQSIGANLKETNSVDRDSSTSFLIELITNTSFYLNLIKGLNPLVQLTTTLIERVKDQDLIINSNYVFLIERLNYLNYLKTLPKSRLKRIYYSLRHKRNLLPNTNTFRASISFLCIELLMKVPDVKS